MLLFFTFDKAVDSKVVRKSSETDSIKFKISSKTSRGKKDKRLNSIKKDPKDDLKQESQTITRHRKRYNPLALYHSSYWSHCWMDTHFLMYLLRVL